MSWQDVRSFYEEWEPEEYDFKPLGKSTQTARKWHQCDVCEGGIAPGQQYESFRALDEGRFVINKHHIDRDQCEAARLDRIEAERIRDEIHNDYMVEQWEQERAGECGTCDGIGLDLFDYVGELCKVCGGAGKWDGGEELPGAFEIKATEPRIPADLTNIYQAKREAKGGS